VVRLRIKYSKTAGLRYTSNLDLHKIWERSLRRARLPLAYSQGFHPQPKLPQACPLPLGMTSRSEIIDVWLETEIEHSSFLSSIQPALPPGLELQSVEAVDLAAPSLPTQVVSADYIVTLLDPEDEIQLLQRVTQLQAASEIRREWRGKQVDLRPLIEEIGILPPDDQGRLRLSMRLAAREGATGRAEQVVAALGYDPFDARVERVKLLLK
jgi:radical SAM-linked protein